MKLTVLGTGHATVVDIYNTCFVLENHNRYLLVDAGGGNRILTRLKEAEIDLNKIHTMFVTHAHTDHVLGVIWIIRMVAQNMMKKKFHGYFRIYCHEELCDILMMFVQATLTPQIISLIGSRIYIIPVKDGDSYDIIDAKFTFFDILSTKMKQYGCTITYDDHKIAFCGDEPYNSNCYNYVKDSDWMFHEAFCLYSQRDKYDPYKKHHSTAKDAGKLANELGVKHIVVWHSEEDTGIKKQELYTAEIQEEFSGDILVPRDLDVIELD